MDNELFHMVNDMWKNFMYWRWFDVKKYDDGSVMWDMKETYSISGLVVAGGGTVRTQGSTCDEGHKVMKVDFYVAGGTSEFVIPCDGSRRGLFGNKSNVVLSAEEALFRVDGKVVGKVEFDYCTKSERD